MKYVVGILVILLGVAMVLKTNWFLQMFGRIGWAEQHLGLEGGSRLFYKLLGIAFIFLSLMGMTGLLGQLILGFFDSYLPTGQ